MKNSETYLREQLLDLYFEAFINCADPDNIDTSRAEIEADFLDALTEEEILTKHMLLSSGAVVKYDPDYGDFIIEDSLDEDK